MSFLVFPILWKKWQVIEFFTITNELWAIQTCNLKKKKFEFRLFLQILSPSNFIENKEKMSFLKGTNPKNFIVISIFLWKTCVNTFHNFGATKIYLIFSYFWKKKRFSLKIPFFHCFSYGKTPHYPAEGPRHARGSHICSLKCFMIVLRI